MASVNAQLNAFLRFSDAKRDLYAAEVEATIRDVQEARLFDDVYSKDDVEELCADIVAGVKERVRRDMESYSCMAALALQQILLAAEEASTSLPPLDTTRLEDMTNLASVREAAASGAGYVETDLKKKHGVKLESMREEHQRLAADNVRLTEECAALRERYMAMQAQASMLTQDKSDLAARVESLSAELAALRSGASAATAQSAAHEAELAKLRASVAELHAQMENAKTHQLTAEKEREASVNMSKPFQMMKAMLVKKNAQLAELRRKLKTYEPEKEEVTDA